MNHTLKTDPAVFQAVADGRKTHEIRLNDRSFLVGDTLVLKETVAIGALMALGAPLAYTGREITKTVSHVLGGYGLQDGWVILSFAPALAAIGASEPVGQEPVYQMRSGSGSWVEISRTAYTHEMNAKYTRRTLYAAPIDFDAKLAEALEEQDDAHRLLYHEVANQRDYERERAEKAETLAADRQAKIDALMLEFCPDEMTPDQMDEWARHQKRVPDTLTAASKPDDGGVSLEGADMRAIVAASKPVEPHPVITLLLNVARLAFDAMDNTEENDTGLHWSRDDFDALSAAVDKLDALPDDRPGYTMGPAAKAEWALRGKPVEPAPIASAQAASVDGLQRHGWDERGLEFGPRDDGWFVGFVDHMKVEEALADARERIAELEGEEFMAMVHSGGDSYGEGQIGAQAMFEPLLSSYAWATEFGKHTDSTNLETFINAWGANLVTAALAKNDAESAENKVAAHLQGRVPTLAAAAINPRGYVAEESYARGRLIMREWNTNSKVFAESSITPGAPVTPQDIVNAAKELSGGPIGVVRWACSGDSIINEHGVFRSPDGRGFTPEELEQVSAGTYKQAK